MSDISNEFYFSSVSESSDDDNLNVSASERMSKEADEVNLLKIMVQLFYQLTFTSGNPRPLDTIFCSSAFKELSPS